MLRHHRHPLVAPRLDAGSPSTSAVPEVAGSRPATMRSRVDLPHPDGPMMLTKDPCSMSRSIPAMASSVPNDLRNARSETALVMVD